MKIGDIVMSTCPLYEDASDIGVIIDIKPAGPDGNRPVHIYWGEEPQFGRPIEWDWEHDLKVVQHADR